MPAQTVVSTQTLWGNEHRRAVLRLGCFGSTLKVSICEPWHIHPQTMGCQIQRGELSGTRLSSKERDRSGD